MISQIAFGILLLTAVALAAYNARAIIRNVRIGRPEACNDRPVKRLQTMLLIAFGQKKMFKRPFAALLHLLVYLGFFLINIELLEIVIDGLFGTHRIFSVWGRAYDVGIAALEWLALAVLVGCLIFLARRNLASVHRFFGTEMTAWPKTDANLILIAEILLMLAFLTMNAAEYQLQQRNVSPYYTTAGAFPVSNWLSPLLPQTVPALIFVERFAWWLHIIGVLAFLNYLPYSKHLHILLAFPNTYFANLRLQGHFPNMPQVTNEVRAMTDPAYTPQAADGVPRFGVKDVGDLTWKNLLDAYTCTECGRCTAVCPANITGKLLSPRKIMMDTRDRMVEIGKNGNKNNIYDDEKSLLDHYITREEIWACTTCNACVEACPVMINPLEIIMGLRQYIVLEESQGPGNLSTLFSNVENNGAPWKYAQADRANWRQK